jgi:hypothetical protein
LGIVATILKVIPCLVWILGFTGPGCNLGLGVELRSEGEGKYVEEEADFGDVLTTEDDAGRRVGPGSAEDDKREGEGEARSCDETGEAQEKDLHELLQG